MGYFFCSPHEQHVKMKIKKQKKTNACRGNKLGLVAILQKEELFHHHSKPINIQASWI